MKQFQYLFLHFDMFQLVWIAIGLDTTTGIISAIVRKVFVWSLLQLWVQKLFTITAAMVVANAVEHFVLVSGHDIQLLGFVPVSSGYFLQEINSVKINLENIWPQKAKEL